MLCPNQECQNTNFDINSDNIHGDDYMVVTCSCCNKVIGVYPDPQPLLDRIKELESKIEDLESRISDLED